MRTYSKNRTIYTVLIAICIVGFWLFENFYTPNTYSKKQSSNTESNLPSNFLPSSTTGEVVHHNHFSLSYNETYEQAEWVAYVLKKEHMTYDDRKRPYFIEDPYVATKSADWRNYISPQDRQFNAGLWNRLEMQTRTWAKSYKTLYVFTGGVLTNGLDEIGAEDVAVPDYFYKIIAKENNGNIEVLGFLMQGVEQNKPLQHFVVPVDYIEELTGIDFFYQLTKEKQSHMETAVDLKNWKF